MSIIAEFNIGEKVVYPSHGVGEIVNVEVQSIGGMEIRVYVVSFALEKMILRVPVNKAVSSGLRTLSNKDDLEAIYTTLQSKPKKGNRMWSRRAQEYEAKINSGNIIFVTEVVRDLHENISNDRSYSERTLYESALNRLAGEIAVLENISKEDAVNRLIETLKEKMAA